MMVKGTIIYEGAILTANIEIGNHVIISPKCGVGHDTVIKDFVSLLWNVKYPSLPSCKSLLQAPTEDIFR